MFTFGDVPLPVEAAPVLVGVEIAGVVAVPPHAEIPVPLFAIHLV